MRLIFDRRRPGHSELPIVVSVVIVGVFLFGGYLFAKKVLPWVWKSSSQTSSKEGDGGPGQILYESRCAVCHGKDGKGNAALRQASRDLTSKPWRCGTDSSAIREMLLTGIPGKSHPTLKQLPDDDLDRLVSYVRDFAPDSSSAPSLREAIRAAGWEQVDRAAPALNLRNPKGEVKSLSVGRGKVVLLCFWSITCPPAKAQITGMETLLTSVPDADFLLVPVCTDPISSRQAEQEMRNLNSTMVSWTLVEPNSDERFGVEATPYSFLIDRDGVIQARRRGLYDPEDDHFIRLVRRLLDRE